MIMIFIATKHHLMIINYEERQSLTLVQNYTHGYALSSEERLHSWFRVLVIFYEQHDHHDIYCYQIPFYDFELLEVLGPLWSLTSR